MEDVQAIRFSEKGNNMRRTITYHLGERSLTARGEVGEGDDVLRLDNNEERDARSVLTLTTCEEDDLRELLNNREVERANARYNEILVTLT